MNKLNKDLGYLGPDFQYRLVHHFMEDKKYFSDMFEILDNNMFTDPNLRRFTGALMNYFDINGIVPSYETIEIELRKEVKDDYDIELIVELVQQIKDTTDEGVDTIKKTAHKFFKQQNYAKIVNKVSELLKNGDVDRVDELEDIWRKALISGNRDDLGTKLKDDLADVLSDEYRQAIPTGVDGIDESLEGGLGKGELGVIIGPSGFGKTSMTTAFANQSASQGYKTVQIVFEDKPKQIQRKHISRITNIEARDLSKPENIERVRAEMENVHIFDDTLRIKKYPTGEVTPIQIKNYLKKLTNSGFKPDIVFIDYFECLAASKNYKDVWIGEGHTMRELEAIASDLDVALWVPTQGTKDSLSAEIVTMDKAGGSFKKIQIAHIVLSISRTNEDIEGNIATIAILKNRSGRSGKVMNNIYFNNGTCVINTDSATVFNSMDEYKKDEVAQVSQIEQDIMREIRGRNKDKIF